MPHKRDKSGRLIKKQAYSSGRYRPNGAGSLGRGEHIIDEDRPFAEIRKTLHDALRMLSLHRWAFFIPFSIVTCAVFVLSLYYPRTYRATTSFERRNDPVMTNLPISAGAASFKYFRNTIVQDLTSIECMSEVAENLGLTKDFERNPDGTMTGASIQRRNALARSLASGLKVSTVSPSEQIDIIRITYTGPDPTIGRKLVDEVKHTYGRRTMVWIHNFLTSQRDYFEREAQEARAEVKKTQREETRLRLENPHVDPTNPGAISLKLAQLEMERRELQLRQREYEAELSALQQLLAATEPPVASEPGPADEGEAPGNEVYLSPQAHQLSGQVREVDQKIVELRTTRGMTDLHPEIQKLLVRHRWLQDELEHQRAIDHTAAVTNGSLDTMAMLSPTAVLAGQPYNGDRARLLVQIAAQKAKLKDIEISMQTNELATNQLRQAKREVYDKQEEFAEITGLVAQAKQKQRRLETTLTSIEPAIKAIEQDRLLQFSEGQPARGSSIPISPKSQTIVLLSLLAGLATGVVFVVLAEVFDHVYRASGQVARSLGLPLLESIDEIITAKDRRYLFLRRAVVTPLIVTCLVGLTGFVGSMAYLSIEQPWTYQKIRKIPQAAVRLFADQPPDTQVH